MVYHPMRLRSIMFQLWHFEPLTLNVLTYRERGARALEERLAAAKGEDGSHVDASEEV